MNVKQLVELYNAEKNGRQIMCRILTTSGSIDHPITIANMPIEEICNGIKKIYYAK